MQITLDTNNPQDLSLLASLAAALGGEAPAPAAKPAPAPAKKAAASKPAPAPVEEPEDEVEEETQEEETSEPTPTTDDAVALATKMVSNGEAAKVKAALNSVGAKKVSEVPADKVGEFIAALS